MVIAIALSSEARDRGRRDAYRRGAARVRLGADF